MFTVFDEISARTNFSINNKDGEKSTLTLNKLASDILHKVEPDVHCYVQDIYNAFMDKYPDLGRKKAGNLVREHIENHIAKNERKLEAMCDICGCDTVSFAAWNFSLNNAVECPIKDQKKWEEYKRANKNSPNMYQFRPQILNRASVESSL